MNDEKLFYTTLSFMLVAIISYASSVDLNILSQ